ncbi:MAG: GNAT family N-acetyltransferase [Phormidesmis sp.]
MNIRFLAAQSVDLPILMKYMKAFHEFDHITPFDEISARSAMEKIVFDKTIGRVWLIQQTGDIVGYIVLTLAFRLEYRGYYAFLDELYVRADSRGQGIGTAALAFLKQACSQIGVQTLQLEVKHDNSNASNLYYNNGFSRQERYVLVKQI